MPLLIRSACLTGFADLARALGLDPHRLLRAANLDRSVLLDPDIKIPCDTVARLLDTSAAEAGIDDFGLRLSEDRRLSNLGPLALGSMFACTLRQGLEAAMRFMPLHSDATSLSIRRLNGAVILQNEPLADAYVPGRQSIELGIGVAHRFIRELCGQRWRPRSVWFSHGLPRDLTTYSRIFGPWVEFGRDYNGVVLEPSDLELKLPGCDPVMARHVMLYLEPLLAQIPMTVHEKTRQFVYAALPSRRVSAEVVASQLGLNRRSLHRQLSRVGTTFSSIVDEVRSDLAKRYVNDRGLSITDVAHLLGFSESSAFSRWFRGEFDCSPTEWRSTA